MGKYDALDLTRLSRADQKDQQTVTGIQENAKKEALKTVALFPIGMLASYIMLIFYFKSKGGYKAVLLPGKKSLTPA